MFRKGILTLAASTAIVLLMLSPAAASADRSCGYHLRSPGGDVSWEPDDDDGEFEDAFLLVDGNEDERGDAFDGYGVAEIDGEEYENPNTEGCEVAHDGDTLRFPADEVGGLKVKPQLYVGDNRALGRQYVKIKNTGDAPVTFDFGFDGELGSDGDTEVDRTSSGDGVVDTRDRWATSCEDQDDDGCASKAGEPDRDPELAHNWERDGGDRDSAETIELEDGSDTSCSGTPECGDNYDVTFEDVTIGPGQSAAYMEIVSLRRGTFKAREAAREAGAAPSYVFAELSSRQRTLLRNW
jgi:hypothetical protein